MNIDNICVLGNDGRMDYTAQMFYDAGYEVSRDINDVIEASVVVLPPPVGDKELAEIFPLLKVGQLVYGGAVSNRFIHECELMEICAIDYLKWDYVTHKNALLTANGIVREALSAGAVIERSNCLVAGYGFCGKTIADALTEHGAYVDVMVRKRGLSGEINGKGYGFVNLNSVDSLQMEKYSYIFNTIPAMIFTEKFLKMFSGNIMIFDIASAPGGTDLAYCRSKGIFAVNSLGIPGKEFPKEAGEIIAHAVLRDLSQK